MSASSTPPKRKLLVILGAGSSVPCGIPGVVDLNARMKEWSSQWSDPPPFPPGSIGEGVFNDLWKFVDSYMQRNPRPQLGLQLNFERVLGEMISLASWTTPSPFGNPLQAALRDPHPSPGFTWPQGGEGDYYYRHLIVEQLGFLLRKLAVFMREQSRLFDAASEAFAAYRSIVDALRREFAVGIYNLNYDNLAIRSWPDAFTGFRDNRFNAREVASREDWDFIYHLHGSVHYSLTGLVSQNEVTWLDDLSGDFEDSRPLMPNMASNFIPIIPTTLIAGGYKLDQLLYDPSQSFYASLVRHVHSADAILLVGYGFGDVHVNRALKNKFDTYLYNPAERPSVAIVTKTTAPMATIGEREGYEFYAWELTHSINSRFAKTGTAPPHVPIANLIAENRFEFDNINRSAVWHGGFLELAPYIDRLLHHLGS
jgi:hypothetical protein